MLPGRDETLRVNGRAWLTTDDDVLDGFTAELRRPKAAIGVEVVDAFVHCAKSFRRGQVWDPASWAPDVAPSAAELLTCHIELDATPEQLAANLEKGYAHDLAAERADAAGLSLDSDEDHARCTCPSLVRIGRPGPRGGGWRRPRAGRRSRTRRP